MKCWMNFIQVIDEIKKCNCALRDFINRSVAMRMLTICDLVYVVPDSHVVILKQV